MWFGHPRQLERSIDGNRFYSGLHGCDPFLEMELSSEAVIRIAPSWFARRPVYWNYFQPDT